MLWQVPSSTFTTVKWRLTSCFGLADGGFPPFLTGWTSFFSGSLPRCFNCRLLSSAALHKLAALSNVSSDDSRSNLSFSRESLTPKTGRSRIMLSVCSPNSHDLARVLNSVINWSIVSPSCCLHSQNLYTCVCGESRKCTCINWHIISTRMSCLHFSLCRLKVFFKLN